MYYAGIAFTIMEHVQHLCKDRRLKKLVEEHGPIVLRKRKKVYLHLCFSIMSQQLSTKVADVIQGRFMQLYKNMEPSAEQVLKTSHEQLRAIGLSNAKVTYVHNVCRFFIEERIEDKTLHKMDDEELIHYLTRIKGVGRWTTEMILMFTLGREDVFALDDLGIQQAMISLYKIEAADKKSLREQMLKISAKWSPYRSYACMYLWRHKDKNAGKK